MKLGKQSQILEDFVGGIVANSPFPKTKKQLLSPMSRLFLKRLLDRLRIAYNHFRHDLLMKIAFPTNTWQQSDLFTSIPADIRDIIVCSPKTVQSYEFTVGSRNVRIHMLLPGRDQRARQQTQDYFLHTAILTWLWFHTVSENIQDRCAQSLDIYLYLTRHYKMKPEKGAINIIHANTAYTRTCTPTAVIQIFREEEWFKVLIHETFHTLGLDFSDMPEFTTHYSKTLQNMFHVKTDGLLFETYCETWATIVNTMFVAAFSAGPMRTLENNSKIIAKMENIFSTESQYSLFQSAKVLRHMGISYADFIHPDAPASQTKLRQYREHTNVLCYYVLKYVLLYHLDHFLQWCWVHNDGSLRFVKTPGNLKSFYAMIRHLYRSRMYVKEHLHMETHVKHGEHGFEQRTLRMTIYG